MNRWNKALAVTVGMLGVMTLALYSERFSLENADGNSIVVSNKPCVVLDAGHGGDDPGKIGIHGEQEKDINLQIAQRVRMYLEQNDISVVMTREDDQGMYDRKATNRKVRDMKNRIELMEETEPEVVVSIHQNSYPQEEIHGAQMFYYKTSDQGKRLAEILQESFCSRVDAGNKRQIKPNDSYYLLKKTRFPIVIAECGFLSNAEEAARLSDKEYQDRVSWALAMGIMQYLNEL